MNEDPHSKDWIDTVVRWAGFLGFNQVRLRWRLMAWRESLKNKKFQGRAKMDHVNYANKICSSCGAIQDRSAKTCVQCGSRLQPHFWQVLGRLGMAFPKGQSVSHWLAVGIFLCYLRMIWFQGASGLTQLDSETFVDLGALFPPAIEAGQWWRFSTYIFLHGGWMHILFNLMALIQIGPPIEEIFGKARTLFYFMVTGILAGVGSYLIARHGLVVGASGALLGLMGLAAGWGQRDGTSTGRNIRDQMVKWLIYTVLFGFFVHADNTAHLTGFAVGWGFGFVSKPQWELRGRSSWVTTAQGFLGAALALGTMGLVFFPPSF